MRLKTHGEFDAKRRLGKGEVDSSILSGSTSFRQDFATRTDPKIPVPTPPCPKTWHGADTDNGAGQRPPLRRNIADALLAVAIAAGCIAGLAMWGHEPPVCGISAQEAMPWVLEQRAGCLEPRP